MPSHLRLVRKSSADQVAIACLLILGLFFPTSTNGVHSELCVLIAFAMLLGLLLYLAYKHGTRHGAMTFVALPILIILTGCTLSALSSGTSQFDWGIFVKFCSLSILLSLNLRRVSANRSLDVALLVVNTANVICGVAILVGSQWISGFLPKYYWSFYPELMPNMVALHKPVLALGTHASAAFFLYLFFWVNWEGYRRKHTRLALLFAFSYFVLLLGLTSFTSIGFGAVALVQMMAWYWKNNRKLFFAIALCTAAAAPIGLRLSRDQISDWMVVAELGSKFFNTEGNGPLIRYGREGLSRRAIGYILDHPLSQIGFATPPDLAGGQAALGDSGPTEYILRGSLPLLILMYFGLYRFLRFNLTLRIHAIWLFMAVVAFESAFSLLIYVRTLYLLPFFVIYLNGLASTALYPAGHESVPVSFQPRLFTGRGPLQGGLPSYSNDRTC